MRLCLISFVACFSLWADVNSPEPGAASAGRVPVRRTGVRVDQRSGRLVRSVLIESRVVETPVVVTPVVDSPIVESQPVMSQEVRPLEPRTGLAVRTATRPQDVRAFIAEAARKHDVDPMLVESMVQVESNYNPRAVSHKGAMGLMQLIPATAKRFGVVNPFDAQQNIEGGVRYLKYLQQLYRDDRLALAAYNAGEGAVARYGSIPPYAETQQYVYEVGRRYGVARRAQRAIQATMPATPPPPRIETFTDEQGRIHYRMP